MTTHDQALATLIVLGSLACITGFVVFCRRQDTGRDNDWFWNIVTFILRIFDSMLD